MENLKILTIITVIFMMFSVSCEIKDSILNCEDYNYGKVIIKNETNTRIFVNITTASFDLKDERMLLIGNYTTYSRLPIGNTTIWVSTTGRINTWYTYNYHLSTCEVFNYTWYESTDNIIKNYILK